MVPFIRRVVAILGATALAATVLGLGAAPQPARAATVSVSVTCSNPIPVVDITAAQGDTVEVTIDNGCYNTASSPHRASSATPSSWQLTHFSSWPSRPNNQGTVDFPVNKFTWVIATNAPLGPMAGATNLLPYVCNVCQKGAYLKFTITAASTTTLAPTTTVPATTTTVAATTTVPATTTTVAATTTVPATTTTEPRPVVMAATLPETGAGRSTPTWAVAFMGVGVLLLGTARFRARARKI